jgi:hypothetical protein
MQPEGCDVRTSCLLLLHYSRQEWNKLLLLNSLISLTVGAIILATTSYSSYSLKETYGVEQQERTKHLPLPDPVQQYTV